MATPTPDDLRLLIAHEQSPCLSVYLPIEHEVASARSTRWSALASEIRKALVRYPDLDVDAFLQPLHGLSDPNSWDPHAKGLAAFRSPSWSVLYWLPALVAPALSVSNRFQLRPLLEFARHHDRYFLLDLTQDRVLLFAGRAHGLTPLVVRGLPASLTDAVGKEHAERVVSVRSSGPGQPVWHGQGKDESARREDDMKFVRAVDEALRVHLHEESAPLLVAGSGKLLALFRSRCTYPHLMPDSLHGSHANTPIDELHAQAWPIFQSHLEHQAQRVIERHRSAVSCNRATDEITSMARYAVEGRIGELLVDRDACLRGRMDAVTGAVDLRDGGSTRPDEDVLDDLVEAVLLHGGQVHAFEADHMPTRAPAAATLRW